MVAGVTYEVVLFRRDEGFTVSCPGLLNCDSHGRTESEALENIKDAIREHLGSWRVRMTYNPPPPYGDPGEVRYVEIPDKRQGA